MSLMPQSPTSVGTYATCPKQYQAKYITKEIKFIPNAATERGSKWHKYLEDRMREQVALPDDLAHFEQVMLKLEQLKGEVITEKSFAVDSDFNPCEWPQRYIGGNIDLGFINHEQGKATLFDYKTGKVKHNDDFQFQLLVYALMVMKSYPHIRRVRVAYLFLDFCKISPVGSDGKLGEIYTREDLGIMQTEVFHKIERIRVATEKNEWLPNPSGLCRPNKPSVNGGFPWCQVKSCPFWNKR